MFELRGMAVSLASFIIFYIFLSALVSVCARPLRRWRLSEPYWANLLFAVRIFPLVASALMTGAFVIPSFQLLEPRSTSEGIGPAPLVLGICSVIFLLWGCFRLLASQRLGAQMSAKLIEVSQPLESSAGTINVVSGDAPPVLLLGTSRPQVFVSGAALKILEQDELQAALRHEASHMRSRDNLKKLLFRLCPFPGMSALEAAWVQAAEIAADDAAVSNEEDALALASAMVKLSRLVAVAPTPAFATGFVTGSVSGRVERLLLWSESRGHASRRIRNWAILAPMLIAVVPALTTYASALAWAHEMTEWLVR